MKHEVGRLPIEQHSVIFLPLRVLQLIHDDLELFVLLSILPLKCHQPFQVVLDQDKWTKKGGY